MTIEKQDIEIEDHEIKEIKHVIEVLRTGGDLPIKTIPRKWRELICSNLEIGLQNYEEERSN